MNGGFHAVPTEGQIGANSNSLSDFILYGRANFLWRKSMRGAQGRLFIGGAGGTKSEGPGNYSGEPTNSTDAFGLNKPLSTFSFRERGTSIWPEKRTTQKNRVVSTAKYKMGGKRFFKSVAPRELQPRNANARLCPYSQNTELMDLCWASSL